jgi:hypothetical protein
MDQAVRRVPAAVVDRLLEGIQDNVGVQRGRHPPADDAAREDIDDERAVEKGRTPVHGELQKC